MKLIFIKLLSIEIFISFPLYVEISIMWQLADFPDKMKENIDSQVEQSINKNLKRDRYFEPARMNR